MALQLEPKLRREELEEYRSKWTTDTPEMRTLRFRSEARPNPVLRRLPGTPMAFERLREKVIEKFGILGLSTLRAALGKDRILGLNELSAATRKIGIEVSKFDINAVRLFCDIITPWNSIYCCTHLDDHTHLTD